MGRAVAVDGARSRVARLAIGVAVGAVAAIGGAFVVWFVGFELSWAVAAVLALGPVTGVLATLTFDETAPWDPPAHEAPRGTRLAIVTIEKSLAACDRLARPTVVRRVGALLMPERDDKLARSTVVRRTRDLLTAELHDRGLDPANGSDRAAVSALLGPDALTILEPNDSTPVTTDAIARCLDAVERLGPATPRS